MVGRRVFGILILVMVIIVAILALWYIGSQKTVYDVMLSYPL